MESFRVIELLKEIKNLIVGESSNEWMDINKASAYCDCSVSTLRRNVKDNKLKA